MLKNIHIENFRSIKKLSLNCGQVNLIVGPNNVGKTAFLEAIYLLLSPSDSLALFDLAKMRDFRHERKRRLFQPTPRISGDRGSVVENTLAWYINESCPGTSRITSETSNNDTRAVAFCIEKAAATTEDVDRDFIYTESLFQEIYDIETILPREKEFNIYYSIGHPGSSGDIKISILPNGLIRTRGESNILDRSSVQIIPSKGIQTKDNATIFSKLEGESKADPLIEAMRILEPKLRRISLGLQDEATPYLRADLGTEKMIPMDFMGEGVGRLLAILLRLLLVPGGVLLIDEIENGIYYKGLEPVWKVIFELAKKTNTQIFATTHSRECLVAAHNVAPDGFLFNHSFRQSADGVDVSVLDKEELGFAMERKWEVR